MPSAKQEIRIIYEYKPSPEAAFRIAQAFRMLFEDAHANNDTNQNTNQNNQDGEPKV
jgi:hypothetical protein